MWINGWFAWGRLFQSRLGLGEVNLRWLLELQRPRFLCNAIAFADPIEPAIPFVAEEVALNPPTSDIVVAVPGNTLKFAIGQDRQFDGELVVGIAFNFHRTGRRPALDLFAGNESAAGLSGECEGRVERRRLLKYAWQVP